MADVSRALDQVRRVAVAQQMREHVVASLAIDLQYHRAACGVRAESIENATWRLFRRHIDREIARVVPLMRDGQCGRDGVKRFMQPCQIRFIRNG